MLRLSLAALLCVSACGGSSSVSLDAGEDTPSITGVTPNYAPLTGGKRVVIQGRGFLHGNAPPNRVLIAGVECEAAGVIDDQTIEVIVPPGEDYGDAEIVVFNLNGNASATGVFHYSGAPEITSVTPALVEYTGGDTLTINGSGFVDEAAGPVQVFVDGERIFDADIVDDGSITFEAPAGGITGRPTVSLHNDRGEAELEQAYQYAIDGSTTGMWILPSDVGGSFAAWFDPATSELTTIPRNTTPADAPALKATARDADGNTYGVGRDNRFYRVDFGLQRFTALGNLSSVPAMVFHGTSLIAYQHCGNLVTVDVSNGQASLIVSNLNMCGGGGVASDGTSFYAITETNTQITPVTLPAGTLGTPVTLAPALTPFSISGLAFHAGTLYAVATNQTTKAVKLITINPTTGAVADVMSLPFKASDILDVP